MPEYNFKLLQELVWFVVTALIIFLFQAATAMPDDTAEWRIYWVTLIAPAIRTVAGAMLAAFVRGGFSVK